jgi:hypothetical protein
MKVNRQELASALSLVCKLAPKVKTLKGKPVFDWRANVRLVSHDSTLTVAATDGDNFVHVSVDVLAGCESYLIS